MVAKGGGVCTSTPLPAGLYATVLVFQLAQAITITMPFVVLVYMVRDFRPDLDEGGVGRLTGIAAGLMNAGAFVSSYPLGRWSDSHGRKPVLVTGAASCAVGMLVLGLAPSYGVVCAARLVPGVLNGGSIGALKSLMTEVTDATNRGVAFGSLSTGWGLGTVAGPALGGALAMPCDGFLAGTSFCGTGGLLETYPFLLPCLCGAVASLCSTLMCAFCLRETVQRTSKGAADDEEGGELELAPLTGGGDNGGEGDSGGGGDFGEGRPESGVCDGPWWRHEPTIYAILTYVLIAGSDIVYSEVLPIFASAPRSVGGLALPGSTLASPLMAQGLAVVLTSSTLFPRLERRLGSQRSLLLGVAGTIAGPLVLTPLTSLLRDAQMRVVLLGVACVVKGTVACVAFSSSMVVVSRATPRAHVGAANGASQMLVALARASGPALGGLLWGATVHIGRCGHFVVFAACAALTACIVPVARRVVLTDE